MNFIFSKNIKKLISVVVPCYNSGYRIAKCIDSILDQTYTNLEILIVNDGSTCKITKKLLNFYSKKKNIKILNQKNCGLSSARNKGIKKSNGDYIYFLDADDSISNNCLELLFNKIKKKKNCYSYPYINLVGQKNILLKKNYNFFEELFTNQIPYSCLYPKVVLEKFGGYDENMKEGFEDWELHIRLGKNNIKGICVPGKLFHYNVSEEGMLQSISIKKYYEIYRYIVQKHKSIYSLPSLLKIYKIYKNIKSTHNLKLYFLYIIYLKIFSDYYKNKYLKILLLFSHTSMEQNKTNKEKKLKKIKKILHIITSSDTGGAEKSLQNLINHSTSIQHEVIILKYKSEQFVKYKNSTKTLYLDMYPKRISIFKIYKLYKLISKTDADIINTWLYHSDFLASLCSFFMLRKPKIIWSIHNNNLDKSIIGSYTRLVTFFCKLFSYFSPYLIICASKSSIKTHADYGYNKKIMKFIPPIFFDINIKKKIKSFSKIQNKKKIILGCLARWNIQKNQLFLIDCLEELKKEGFHFHLFMAGNNINNNNKMLINFIKKKKLVKNITLLGEITRVNFFFQRIDLNILPSLSESLPLVISEAQANYTPSLASDVGDVQNIIGNAGWVFKSNDKKSFKNKFKSAYLLFKNKTMWKQKCIESKKSHTIRMDNIKNSKHFLELYR